MILSRVFLQAAEKKKFDEVNKALSLKFKMLFPKCLQNSNEEDIIRHIILQRERCERLHIYTERGIFSFLAIGFLLGEEYLSNECFLSLFHQIDLSGDEILELFYSELNKPFN